MNKNEQKSSEYYQNQKRRKKIFFLLVFSWIILVGFLNLKVLSIFRQNKPVSLFILIVFIGFLFSVLFRIKRKQRYYQQENINNSKLEHTENYKSYKSYNSDFNRYQSRYHSKKRIIPKFCSSCGNQIASEIDQNLSEACVFYCPYCGNKIIDSNSL